MTPVILVILAAVWVVVLAPTAWKKLTGRRSGGSIDSFHHELRLLEHTGPKLIPPAFRLETAYAGGPADRSHRRLPAVSSMPGRAPLVLLEPNAVLEPPATTRSEVPAMSRGARSTSATTPQRRATAQTRRAGYQTPAQTAAADELLAGPRRRRARRRRLVAFAMLLVVVAGTGALGTERPYRLAWVVAGLGVIALLGLGALVGYARLVGLIDAGGRPAPGPLWSRRSEPDDPGGGLIDWNDWLDRPDGRPRSYPQDLGGHDVGQQPKVGQVPEVEEEGFEVIGRRARHAAGRFRPSMARETSDPTSWARFEEFYDEVGSGPAWDSELRQAAGGR
ncbi:MAG TPA: hypothetical protein VGL60_05560 [Acidimicrobiales bacterium]